MWKRHLGLVRDCENRLRNRWSTIQYTALDKSVNNYKKWGFRLSFPLYLSNLPGGVMTLGLSMAPPPIKVGGHCSTWTVFVPSQSRSWDELGTSSDGQQKYGIITKPFILYRCRPSIIDKRCVDCFVHVWKGRLSAMATLPSSPLLPFYHIVLNFWRL